MISNLKETFPSLLHYKKTPDIKPTGYSWFLTLDKELIGFKNTEISRRDFILISSFLNPWNEKLPSPTQEELKWMGYIKDELQLEDNIKYRFIFIKINGVNINTIEVNDVIKEALDKSVSIIWENSTEGIIIEKVSSMDTNIKFEEIIDILMSDLYLNINFYIGPVNLNNENTKEYFDRTEKHAKFVFQSIKKPVVTFEYSIPSIISSEIEHGMENDIIENILGNFKDDKEWLDTVEVFLESNLNISVASKKLYMHRNTFQYKLDKFHSATGMDIRQFKDAFLVQIAIQTLKS